MIALAAVELDDLVHGAALASPIPTVRGRRAVAARPLPRRRQRADGYGLER